MLCRAAAAAAALQLQQCTTSPQQHACLLIRRRLSSMSTDPAAPPGVVSTFVTDRDDLLALERIGENEFRSPLRQKSYKRPPASDKDRTYFLPGIKRGTTAFGGHLITDSMVAALHTTKDASFSVQSFHAHFILGVSTEEPVTYKVEHLRDGQTVNFRSVRAYQDDQTVFAAQIALSSAKAASEFPSHQSQPMPSVPKPDTLVCAHEHYLKALRRYDLSDAVKTVLQVRQSSLSERYEFRYVDAEHVLRLNPTKPIRYVWVRAHDNTATDRRWHQLIAAMITDSQLLSTALQPHIKFNVPFKGFSTSLDHSIVFHDIDFNCNDWVLFDIEATIAVNGRAYSQGKMWTADGRHVMTCTQEGIMRVRFDDQNL